MTRDSLSHSKGGTRAQTTYFPRFGGRKIAWQGRVVQRQLALLARLYIQLPWEDKVRCGNSMLQRVP